MSRIGCALRVAGLIVALTAPAAAQSDANYPNRPIRIVVSVAAGGGVDLSARIIANQLQTLWGQPVTVENRTGGSGNIAGEAVWRAAPDGYTLLATPPNILTANAALFRKLSYDTGTLDTGGDHGGRPERAGGEEGLAGQDRLRADRARQGQCRQAELRLAGQRLDLPSHVRAVQEPDRHSRSRTCPTRARRRR